MMVIIFLLDKLYFFVLIIFPASELEDCHKLVNVLSSYQIQASVVKHNKKKRTYRIRVKKQSIVLLQSLVIPHMHPIFYYKLGIMN